MNPEQRRDIAGFGLEILIQRELAASLRELSKVTRMLSKLNCGDGYTIV